MKILIACSSCWRDVENGSNKAIRETWGQLLPEEMDLRFFIGGRDFTGEERAVLNTPKYLQSPPTIGNALNLKSPTIGNSANLLADEILLADTPDGYLGLPWKTRDSLQWALDHGYDYIFRIFVDTYVFPNRLLYSGFEKHDAVGWTFICKSCLAHPNKEHTCPHGGCGYWTSRRAAQAIIYYTDAELEKMTDVELDALGAEYEYVEE
jgi:hypothetical protein